MKLMTWYRKHKLKKAAFEQSRRDEYLERLHNSAIGFCGCRYSGSGPFLTVSEVHALIFKEVERLSESK